MFNIIGLVVSSDKEKKVYRGCYLLSYQTIHDKKIQLKSGIIKLPHR